MEQEREKDSSERLPLLLLLHCPPPPPSADTPVGSPGMECHRVIAKVALLLTPHPSRHAPLLASFIANSSHANEGVTFSGTAVRAVGRSAQTSNQKAITRRASSAKDVVAVGSPWRGLVCSMFHPSFFPSREQAARRPNCVVFIVLSILLLSLSLPLPLPLPRSLLPSLVSSHSRESFLVSKPTHPTPLDSTCERARGRGWRDRGWGKKRPYFLTAMSRPGWQKQEEYDGAGRGRRYALKDFCTQTMIQTFVLCGVRYRILSSTLHCIATHLSSSLPSFVLGEEGRRKDADVVPAHVPPQLVAGVSLRRHQQRAAKTRLGCHLPGLRRRQLSQPSPGASASSLCKQRARRKPGRCRRRRRPVCRMAMRRGGREGEGWREREREGERWRGRERDGWMDGRSKFAYFLFMLYKIIIII